MNSDWDKYCLFHGKISLLALLLNFFDFYIEFYAVKAPYILNFRYKEMIIFGKSALY